MGTSAHIDRFVFDHLPPEDQQPELVFDLPELAYPDRLNAGGDYTMPAQYSHSSSDGTISFVAAFKQ